MKKLGTYATWLKNAYRFLNKSGLGFLAFALALSACNAVPHVDLAPPYEPVEFVVPDSYHGSGPFLKARPSDDEIRLDWWTLFHDPVLNKLEEQAMASNPSLQASAERFVQASPTLRL